MRSRLRESASPALNATLAASLALGCPFAFVAYTWPKLLARVDRQLTAARPLITQEASVALQRPVSIGKLSLPLSLAAFQSFLTTPERYESYSLVAEDVTLGFRPGEERLAGQPWLARVQRATATLSIPSALAGNFTTKGLKKLELDQPELVVVRDPKGKLNLERLLPETQEPVDPTQPPFQTEVIVRDGRVSVRDFASARAPGRLEENHFTNIRATVNLSGPRTLRFIAQLTPDRQTRAWVRQPILVAGMARRGEPGARPDSPTAELPRLHVSIDCGELDFPYPLRYALSLPKELQLTQGRGEIHAELLLPGTVNAPPQLRARTRFRSVALKLTKPVTVAVDDASGELQLENNRVQGSLSGQLLGERFLARGGVQLGGDVPQIDAQASMLRAPLTRLLTSVARATLPRELTLSPLARLEQVALRGPLTAPRLTARLSGVGARWKGFPGLENLTADLRLENGEVHATDVVAQLTGGGQVTARAQYRFAQANGGPLALSQRQGVLEAHLREASLTQVEVLQALKTPPTGKLSVDIQGTLKGESFQGDAQVRARELQLANLRFPTAYARLALREGTRFQLVQGQLAGPAGTLQATGSGTLGATFSSTLEGNLVGADLGLLASAFGLPGLGGTLSVSASLAQTGETATIQLRDITVLQPHYRFESRLFVADAAHAERATLRVLGTGQVRAEVDPAQPLRLYHSPALATVSGTITGGKDAAQLNLTARAEDLEVDELLRQAGEEPGRFAQDWLRGTPGYLPLLEDLDWTGNPSVPASGRIRSVVASLTGDASNPTIQGEVSLGRLLVASFPLDGGQLAFSVEDHNLRLYDLALRTATGTITGEASLSPLGALAGTLTAPELDLKALSSLAGLVDRQLGVTGALGAQVTLSGTRESPRLVARLTEVRPLELAGLPLVGLTLGELQVETELREGEPLRGTLRLPLLSVRLGGTPTSDAAAQLSATDLTYDLETQRLGGNLSLTQAHFQKVAALLRRGHFDDTQEGKDFLQALYELPKNVDATLALTGSVSGRFTEEGLRERRANLRLSSRDVYVQAESDTSTFFRGNLDVRAALQDEILTLDSLSLTQTEAPDGEPAIVRALPHPRRDPVTGEQKNGKSWFRLPYSPKELPEYHVTIDANAIPLELGRLFDPNFQVRGRATLTVGADGTTEIPSVSASFYANNLLVGSLLAKAGQFSPPPLALSLARFQVDLKGSNAQDWNITISDGLLTHEKENLTFEGVVPLDHKNRRVAAARAINLSVASTEGVGAATLSPYLNLRGVELAGTLRGGVALMGTLNSPLLGGKIELLKGSARFPGVPPRAGRDLLNPISSLELAIELSGREVRFPRASLTMAPLASRPKTASKESKPTTSTLASLPSAGTFSLAPTSVIRIENLEDFTRLFVRTEADATQPKLRGEFDLVAQFSGFSIDSDNLSSLWMGADPPRSLGLGEALAARLEGTLRIQGPLLSPRISTPPNTKLTLTNVVFQVPRNEVPEVAGTAPLVFNPRFSIEVATGNDARLVNQAALGGLTKLSGYQFQGMGTVSISGDLAAPRIEGALVPTGGYYNYPLASFKVQRGGEIRLVYARSFEGGANQRQFDIRLTDVLAEAKVTVTPSAITTARSAPRAGELASGGGLSDESLVGRGVRVTARFNGPLQMGGTTGTRSSQGMGMEPTSLPIELSSDSNLTADEIKSLLFPADAIVQAIFNNGSQQLLRDSISILGNSLSGRYLLDPVTSQLRDFFGLDTFNVDYNFNGQANLFLSRRLAPPLDRVTIEVRRSFQTRAATGILLPQLYSVNYELFQLRRGTRLQLGASTNEQRDNQFFLKGTLRY